MSYCDLFLDEQSSLQKSATTLKTNLSKLKTKVHKNGSFIKKMKSKSPDLYKELVCFVDDINKTVRSTASDATTVISHINGTTALESVVESLLDIVESDSIDEVRMKTVFRQGKKVKKLDCPDGKRPDSTGKKCVKPTMAQKKAGIKAGRRMARRKLTGAQKMKQKKSAAKSRRLSH